MKHACLFKLFFMSSLISFITGCSTMDVPQAFRGRMFDRTGPIALYTGGNGFTGPVLGPGTYFTGAYDELMMVDCSTVTEHDPLKVLTKDGVQFGIDIYVRFSANCSDKSVVEIMNKLTPDRPHAISTKKLYETYVRPTISGVVREVISPLRANEINDKHQETLANIRKRFLEEIESNEGNMIQVYGVTLSNLDFPDAMDRANEQRAVQTVLRDKAIAEREKVKAEIATTIMRKDLMQRQGEAEAAKINAIGAALKRNPSYIRYDLQAKMPEIYEKAGTTGNMVITAPSPTIMLKSGKN